MENWHTSSHKQRTPLKPARSCVCSDETRQTTELRVVHERLGFQLLQVQLEMKCCRRVTQWEVGRSTVWPIETKAWAAAVAWRALDADMVDMIDVIVLIVILFRELVGWARAVFWFSFHGSSNVGFG